MNTISGSIEELREAVVEHEIHTIELAVPDGFGHLRGKRIPVDRFLGGVHSAGAHIADAIFVMDIQNDLPDNEFVNMDTGFLDTHLVPDLTTGRAFTHRPGYGIVFADSYDENGDPHPLAPRQVLAAQIERCRAAGLDPVVATEMEFFLCTPDWVPVQEHIQYSSLTDALELEEVLRAMRDALLGVGIDVESSNAEYGGGQIEINAGPTDAMTAADNAVLFKSVVKQVAVQHGLRATFMPKPWAEQSGSGMHIHTSLAAPDGTNAFAASEGDLPNELMRAWMGGMLEHAMALTLLAAPSANGTKRIRPYTFAPTHVAWGLDNRTVLARCIVTEGSAGNRVEYRLAGADSNPYLMIGGLLAAGIDGVERSLDPGAMSTGDVYGNPGESTALPTNLTDAVAAFSGSPLAAQLGDTFSRSFVSLAEYEVGLVGEHSPDADDVNDWERARFIEFS